MDRTERTGLGVAVAGHVILFALLSLGLVSKAKLPPMTQPIDVQFVDTIGMKSAAPQKAVEPPAESQAPEIAKPEEPAPAPEPTPAPPEPKPTPAPPKPEPKPTPKPEPKKVEKPAPAKPAEDKEPRRRPDKDERAAKTPPVAKPTGARLGPDFLKGIVPEKSAAKGQAPRAQAVSALAMQGLAAAIKRQVQPCYELGALQGTPAMDIVTVLDLQFNRDGTVAGDPTVAEQTGVNASNQAYRRQIAEVARRAVQRCAPLHLPPELYDGGWSSIKFVFTPGQMG